MNDYTVSEKERNLLAEFLKKKREEKKFGLNQFCTKADIQASQYSRLENGQLMKINPYLLQKIAKGLQMDYRKLYKIIGYLDDSMMEEKSNAEKINDELISIPVYDSVSAGAGCEAYPEPVDFLTLPKDMAFGCILINVHGESMEPTLQDGCRILVKREVEVANNDIGVFIYNNEAYVKRYKTFQKKIFLYSDNIQYPPMEVRKNDDFQVCGKVIWIMNKL